MRRESLTFLWSRTFFHSNIIQERPFFFYVVTSYLQVVTLLIIVPKTRNIITPCSQYSTLQTTNITHTLVTLGGAVQPGRTGLGCLKFNLSLHFEIILPETSFDIIYFLKPLATNFTLYCLFWLLFFSFLVITQQLPINF